MTICAIIKVILTMCAINRSFSDYLRNLAIKSHSCLECIGRRDSEYQSNLYHEPCALNCSSVSPTTGKNTTIIASSTWWICANQDKHAASIGCLVCALIVCALSGKRGTWLIKNLPLNGRCDDFKHSLFIAHRANYPIRWLLRIPRRVPGYPFSYPSLHA